MVVHQLAPSIIRGQEAVRAHPGVVVVKSVDGIGPAAAKDRHLATGWCDGMPASDAARGSSCSSTRTPAADAG